MRACILALCLLSGCAGDRLSATAPAGIDLSGQWLLNDADSDDPQHVLQSANGGPNPASASGGQDSGQGRGRQGGGRSRGGAIGGLSGPPPPSMGALREAVRFPGKRVEVKQVGGTVAFISQKVTRLCQPGEHDNKPPRRPKSVGRDDDLPSHRDSPPVHCGWRDRSLIVESNDPDEDRPAFEERYALSDDGRRLIEIIEFKGGRSSGYTLSRVWDRVP